MNQTNRMITILMSLILSTQLVSAEVVKIKGPKDSKPADSKPVKEKRNLCQDKFSDHGFYTDNLERQHDICRSAGSWSMWSINGVKWSKYFSCLDKFVSVKEKMPDFYKRCYRNYDELMGKDYKTCNDKIAKFNLDGTLVCSQHYEQNIIVSERFDKCTDELAGTNLRNMTKVNLCSSDTGIKQISCYGTMKKYIPSKQAYAQCKNDFSLRSAAQDEDFPGCMKETQDRGTSVESSIKICTHYDSDKIVKCIENNEEHYDIGTLEKKCSDWNFRQMAQNKYFAKCLNKVKTYGVTQADAVDLCNVSRSEMKFISRDKSFDTCMDTEFSQKIPTYEKIISCSQEDIAKLIKDDYYLACVERGFKSGLLDYFSLKSDEGIYQKQTMHGAEKSNADLITAWSYVFKDCAGDYKYKHEKKKYNRYVKVYRDYNIHTGSKFESEDLKIGGLSAVRVDEKMNQLYLLSDDRGFNTGRKPRIYVYDYNFSDDGEIEINENKIISLSKNKSKDKPVKVKERPKYGVSKSLIRMEMDPEGFDFTKDGRLIVSSEIDDLAANNFINIFNMEGNSELTIPLSEAFIPKSTRKEKCETRRRKKYKTHYREPHYGRGSYGHGAYDSPGSTIVQMGRVVGEYFSGESKEEDKKVEKEEDEWEEYQSCSYSFDNKGFQPNKSLESLSLTEKKDYLFTSNEASLQQDKEKYRHGSSRGERVRIIRYREDQTEGFVEEAQYFYRLENKPDNGLVEILAIDKNNIITLERSWDNGLKKITSRLYFVNLERAENIIESDKDKTRDIRSVHKELIIDLDDLKYELAPGFRKIDNIEGLAFGPRLPNGNDSLVLVSDNNFRQSQRTMILILELDKDKLKRDFVR